MWSDYIAGSAIWEQLNGISGGIDESFWREFVWCSESGEVLLLCCCRELECHKRNSSRNPHRSKSTRSFLYLIILYLWLDKNFLLTKFPYSFENTFFVDEFPFLINTVCKSLQIFKYENLIKLWEMLTNFRLIHILNTIFVTVLVILKTNSYLLKLRQMYLANIKITASLLNFCLSFKRQNSTCQRKNFH